MTETYPRIAVTTRVPSLFQHCNHKAALSAGQVPYRNNTSPNTVTVKSRNVRWAGYVARREDEEKSCKFSRQEFMLTQYPRRCKFGRDRTTEISLKRDDGREWTGFN